MPSSFLSVFIIILNTAIISIHFHYYSYLLLSRYKKNYYFVFSVIITRLRFVYSPFLLFVLHFLILFCLKVFLNFCLFVPKHFPPFRSRPKSVQNFGGCPKILLHICFVFAVSFVLIVLFAELLRARGAKLKTLTLMHNSSSQGRAWSWWWWWEKKGCFCLFVLRWKLLLQKNIINLDHCVLFVLISCYYSHNRSTSEEGNVKKSCFKFYYTSIQMLYNYRKKVQNVKYIN